MYKHAVAEINKMLLKCHSNHCHKRREGAVVRENGAERRKRRVARPVRNDNSLLNTTLTFQMRRRLFSVLCRKATSGESAETRRWIFAGPIYTCPHSAPTGSWSSAYPHSFWCSSILCWTGNFRWLLSSFVCCVYVFGCMNEIMNLIIKEKERSMQTTTNAVDLNSSSDGRNTTSYAGGCHNMPRPCKLIFDLLTLKVVFESRVTWPTSVPVLVFLCLHSRLRPDVRDRQTDRQTSDAHHLLMPPTLVAWA